MINDKGDFSGFIDTADLGIGDRHRDLAAAINSINFNFGSRYVPVFMSAYKGEIDPVRLEYYTLLTQLMSSRIASLNDGAAQ